MELYRVLAIDFGTKRIGLAISDAMRMFAKPFKTIPHQSVDATLEEIRSIVKENNIGRIVVGIPWGLNGNPTEMTEEVLNFVESLKNNFNCQVIGIDERYSTSDANEILKELGYDWSKSKKLIDSMAACMILKRYLEQNKE